MGGNSRFMNEKVDILRPALAVDVTVIRDRILTDYVVIKASARCYREADRGDVVYDANFGIVPVSSYSFFFPKGTSVQQNDVLKFTDPVTDAVTYYDVRNADNFSNHGFHVRCRATLKNYHRGQA